MPGGIRNVCFNWYEDWFLDVYSVHNRYVYSLYDRQVFDDRYFFDDGYGFDDWYFFVNGHCFDVMVVDGMDFMWHVDSHAVMENYKCIIKLVYRRPTDGCRLLS